MKKRLVSGVQPTGTLHLGNYLGALKQWVGLQDEYEAYLFIADLHAITVPQDPAVLRQKTLEVVKIYLASGLDPQKCTFFVQSQISGHTQLAWVLNTLTMIADLDKMTQFKEKTQKNIIKGKKGDETVWRRRMTADEYREHVLNKVGVGLFDYPVLQAADILLYDAEIVPVGEDQLQHVELTRMLARRFNDRFGETFVIPEAKIEKDGARIMGLDNPAKKMSKSAESAYNYIALLDDAETVAKKIKKAVTDSGSEIAYQDDKPALKNLINIYALLSDKKPEAIVAEYQGKGYGEFKDGLTEVVQLFLAGFQKRYESVSDEEAERIIAEGREKAKAQAVEKMRRVYEKVGFSPY